MSVPFKSIRVGPYDVSFIKLTGEDKKNSYGTFSKDDMTIGTQDEYPSRQREGETVLHETLHAVYEVMGVDHRSSEEAKELEERVVGQMSIGLAMLIRDNPKFIDWLKESLK